MGRSKPKPKRRRVDEEGDSKVAALIAASASEATTAAAIKELLAAPPELVEAAAASATRSKIADWPRFLEEAKEDGGGENEAGPDTHGEGDNASNKRKQPSPSLPIPFQGLGKVPKLPDTHYQAFLSLHDMIKSKASAWTSWSGSQDDPRRRAFGFLPTTLGATLHDRLDISMPWQDETLCDEERPKNQRAMVLLSPTDVTSEMMDALQFLCDTLRPFLTSPEMADILQPQHLIAAQPNLHSGRHLLPSHVDHPLKDGFGIIIVTIAMRGDAQVFLTYRPARSDKLKDEGKAKEGANNTEDGTSDEADAAEQGGVLICKQASAYMLSGNVRNLCAHGILADEPCSERESLNLRFGLHDHEFELSNNSSSTNNDGGASGETNTFQCASSQVLDHWGDI